MSASDEKAEGGRERPTRCATCASGNKTVESPGSRGVWIHLYEDGSFIGPCFDPPKEKPDVR
jgi:hypothetical protein